MNHAPLTLKVANSFVTAHHRHNKAVVGHRFSIGLFESDQLVGVAICGRLISRLLDCAGVLEILRLCVSGDAPKNACSYLYRVCYRVWMAMGGKTIITYTLSTESGSSLRGAGFSVAARLTGASWHRLNRVRKTQDVQLQAKIRWELTSK